jgi:hypothetical protein
VGVADPGRTELGAEGDDEQNRQRRDALDHPVEQLERGRVTPVRVLQDQQDGASARQALELRQERPKGARLPLLWGERREGVARVGQQAEQVDQVRQDLVRVRRLGGKGLELREPRRRVVPKGEARRPGELLDGGVERAVPVERRAVVAHARTRLGPQPLPQREHDPRLADPWFAAEQHDLALAAPGEPPAVQKEAQFVVAADQRQRRAGLARREPVVGHPLAPHGEDVHGRLNALEPLRPESLQAEQAADQAPGSVGHDHAAGLGQGLEAGGQVRRLADDGLLARRAFADQLAHDHEPGRDTDPGG